MSDLLTDEDLFTETKPPTRWKNAYRADRIVTYMCERCRAEISYAAREVALTHCRTFPSEDVARTHHEEMEARNRREGRYEAEYLGPVPVEEP